MTSFHHRPEAQHPKSSAIHKNAGRLPRSFGELADGGRQSNAGGAQGETGGWAWRRAQQEALTILFDLGLGQRIEIGQDFRPRAFTAEFGDAVFQGGFEDEREEAARHMAADGLVEFVEDRTRGEKAFGRTEESTNGDPVVTRVLTIMLAEEY